MRRTLWLHLSQILHHLCSSYCKHRTDHLLPAFLLYAFALTSARSTAPTLFPSQSNCYCAQVSPPPGRARCPKLPSNSQFPNCSCAIFPWDLESLKYKIQASSVSKWPKGPGQHVHGAGKKTGRGGRAQQGCQAAELHIFYGGSAKRTAPTCCLPVPCPGSEAFGPHTDQPSFQLTFPYPFTPQEVFRLLEGRAQELHKQIKQSLSPTQHPDRLWPAISGSLRPGFAGPAPALTPSSPVLSTPNRPAVSSQTLYSVPL